MPDPDELCDGGDKGRDAFYRYDNLIERLWNPVKGNNEHRDGECKCGIDKDFNARHVLAAQAKAVFDRTLREKFVAQGLHVNTGTSSPTTFLQQRIQRADETGQIVFNGHRTFRIRRHLDL